MRIARSGTEMQNGGMASEDEAHSMNKKGRKKEWCEQERQKLIVSIPMSHQDLRNLLDYLDREGAPQCNHTLKETIGFLKKRGLDVDRVVAWLHENGGYCDCEVIYNIDEKFGKFVGREKA